MLRVYLASPGFNEDQNIIRGILEEILKGQPNVEPYFPLTMGTKLKQDDFNNESTLLKVFNENVSRMEWCDVMVANLDPSGIRDTGTCFEVGYAIGKGIPVIAFSTNFEKVNDLLGASLNYFSSKVSTAQQLQTALKYFTRKSYVVRNTIPIPARDFHVFGTRIQYNPSEDKHAKRLFHMVPECFILQIDERPVLGSILMGYYYSKGVPVVTYAENPKISCNVMLLGAVRTHVRGKDDLDDLLWVLQANNGIRSISQSSLREFKDVPTT